MARLVDAGADPSEPVERFGLSPLMEVVECDRIVDILLKAGADPNYTNERGKTNLSTAVTRGTDEAVRLLIEAGADVHGDKERLLKWEKNSSGASPAKLRLIEQALAKPVPEELKPWEVRRAIGERDVEIVRGYVEKTPSAAVAVDDEPPLSILTSRCSKMEAAGPVFEIMELLIESGADVNSVGGAMQETPLLAAARQCPGAIVKRLVDAGSNVEARNRADQTPVSLAVFGDNADAFGILLDAGAKVDRTTKFFAKNKPEMKKLLKETR